MEEKWRERKEDTRCERVERCREREMKLDGQREEGKIKVIERERRRERKREIRMMERESERGEQGERDI